MPIVLSHSVVTKLFLNCVHQIRRFDGKGHSHGETARRLLARYTDQTFREPEQWRRWFEQNKDRIYFTDVGGYKFFVVPQGYLDKK